MFNIRMIFPNGNHVQTDKGQRVCHYQVGLPEGWISNSLRTSSQSACSARTWSAPTIMDLLPTNVFNLGLPIRSGAEIEKNPPFLLKSFKMMFKISTFDCWKGKLTPLNPCLMVNSWCFTVKSSKIPILLLLCSSIFHGISRQSIVFVLSFHGEITIFCWFKHHSVGQDFDKAFDAATQVRNE